MHKLLRVCWRRWVTASGVRCSSIKSSESKTIWSLSLAPPHLAIFKSGELQHPILLYISPPTSKSHIYTPSLSLSLFLSFPLSLSLSPTHTIHLGGESWGEINEPYTFHCTQKYFNISLRPHLPFSFSLPQVLIFQHPPKLKTINLTPNSWTIYQQQQQHRPNVIIMYIINYIYICGSKTAWYIVPHVAPCLCDSYLISMALILNPNAPAAASIFS